MHVVVNRSLFRCSNNATKVPTILECHCPCLRPQEESLEIVFRSLPAGSPGTVEDVTKIIDAILAERGVEVGTSVSGYFCTVQSVVFCAAREQSKRHHLVYIFRRTFDVAVA